MKKQSKSIHQRLCRQAFAVSFRNSIAAISAVLALSACTASVALSEEPKPAFEDVPYTEDSNSKNQKLDIYVPQSNHPLPLVLFIHGGGWYEGDKAKPHVLGLLDHGFAVASMNYRLTDEAPFPAQIQDVKAAIRFLRANAAKYNIDPNRIGLWGMSAGGHLAALAGTAGDITDFDGPNGSQSVSTRVQAVVDWYGPTDFTPFASGKEQLGKNVDWMVERFFGGKVTEHQAEARIASPITFVSADDPPMLIMHGTEDTLVPLSQSIRFAEALKQAGAKPTLVVIEGKGHVLFPQEYFDQVTQFFQNNLRTKTAASSPTAETPQTP